MSKRILPLIPSSLVVDDVERSAATITICCRFRTIGAECPGCNQTSQHLHSRYERVIADLPWQGQSVTIRLSVRRLRCANKQCQRQIFAEASSDVVPRYSRYTKRLGDTYHCIGVALGGEAGMRLVARLGMPLSADTILRIVRRRCTDICHTPRVLGVDDWAWRRGQSYGTILIDLETNDVVDLLPDRDASSLCGWLKDHPGIEIIARDRAGSYARGAREGAPLARQVADRWHLLRNCSDALQNVITRQFRLIREVGKSIGRNVHAGGSSSGDETVQDARPQSARQQKKNNQHEGRRALFNEVCRLNQLGWSQLAINSELGVDRKTIRKWLKDGYPGTWERKSFAANPADMHVDYVQSRWNEGCCNATRLYEEVCELGYPGSIRTFRQWVKVRFRDGVPAPSSKVRNHSTWATPSPRRTTRLLTAVSSQLPTREQAFVEAVSSASPELAAAVDLSRRFQSMICNQDEAALKSWIADAIKGPLSSFAHGIRRDIDAVRAALSLPWSSGPIEGQVNKLKLIKRSMYGRAGIELLRGRIVTV